MKIIAFILDRASLRRILQHLQMPAQRPEPLAHSPPLQNEMPEPDSRGVPLSAPWREL